MEREYSLGVKAQAGIQIWILIVATFAFAFFLNASFVEGQEDTKIFDIGRPDLPSSGELTDFFFGTETGIDRFNILKDVSLPSLMAPPVSLPVAGWNYVSDTKVGKWFGKGEWDTLIGKDSTLVRGGKWAFVAAGAIQLFGPMLGMEKDDVNAYSIGISAGLLTYSALDGIAFGTRTTGDSPKIFGEAGVNAGISLLVAAFVGSYAKKSQFEETETETLTFDCMPWQAPPGGDNCEKCNQDKIPCSEYRCKSLGQACGLVNQGTSEEKCIDINPHDAASPGIKSWDLVLTSGYSYGIDERERPVGQEGPAGYPIVRGDDGTATGEAACLEAFTPVSFGIQTSEPAQCKIAYEHTNNFDEMEYYFGDNNLYITNHSQTVSLPGTELLDSLTPDKDVDGEYAFYIRCKDGNGNENADEYEISFCVDKGPDVTAPVIQRVSPFETGSAVQYQVDNVSIEVYTNEPAECSWSRKDASYINMENEMACPTSVWGMSDQLEYKCTTTLTGIKDREENDFYFRCEDLSNRTMSQSYTYTLIGTQPLSIIGVGPNETIGASTSVVTTTLQVNTDNGHSNGVSECSYSATGDDGSYVVFADTDTNQHYQDLDLQGGDYTYYFRCTDAGGNSDNATTSFNVFVDTFAPTVVRAYNENNRIKIVTDEDSDCRYSTETCNYDFEEGIVMPDEDSAEHYADWVEGTTYYVKCSDEYDNQPDPEVCSIVVRPASD